MVTTPRSGTQNERLRRVPMVGSGARASDGVGAPSTPEEYGGSGENNWLECDFGITDWGARPNPVNYFQLSLVTDGPYNESHWSDAEFDALTAKIATEMDAATRADLYKQAQQILIDRGPYIIPFFLDGTLGVSPNSVKTHLKRALATLAHRLDEPW